MRTARLASVEQVGEVERSYPWCGGSGYQAGFLQDIILTKEGVITLMVTQNLLEYMDDDKILIIYLIKDFNL